MLYVVTNGSPKTAMMAFKNTLSQREIELVVDFVRNEFIINKADNTRYHTKENGWENHEQYAVAYPFARGEIPIDMPLEYLTDEQQTGLRLFMSACITCHDRAKVIDDEIIWEVRPVSYPRKHYIHNAPNADAVSEASIYGKHDIPPQLSGLNEQQQRGEKLFQENCAFCHGADGTGKNWIGSFMEPPARNLTSKEQMYAMTKGLVRSVIRNGLPGTKMPAWKNVLTEQQIEDIIAYISVAFYELKE